MQTSTPILFLIFNRPQHTRKVFGQIRKARPARLYVCADGPRPNVAEDAENCRLARKVIEGVDWDCSVKTLFRDTNAGCRQAVKSGIDWFFQHEDAGIILEDDCLPDLSFFPFCAEMLKKYADDERIMHISGFNPAEQACRGAEASYVWSKFSFVWGWATWRRAWKRYDDSFWNWERHWCKSNSPLANLVGDKTACRYMLDKFRRTRDGEIDTWDYAWFYSVVVNGGWCINAASSLVANIGFDETATHTNHFSFKQQTANANCMNFPLRHPKRISRDERIETAFFLASQKGFWGLMLRRLAPDLFFKPLPAAKTKHRPDVLPPLPMWLQHRRTPAQDWV